ncbi:MAG: ATP-binding protein [Myxococcota bacterium]
MAEPVDEPLNPRDSQRRLRRLVFGLLSLVMLLQLVTLLVQRHLARLAKLHQDTVAFADHQSLLVREYERTSYLALVGLATSDWELLLEQRQTAQQLSERFKAGIGTLQQGSGAELGGTPVEVTAIDDPSLHHALSKVLELWSAADDAQVRLLRSNNYQLQGNRDLDAFRAITKDLGSRLDGLNAALRAERGTALADLELLQIVVLVTGLATVGLLGFLVVQRLFIPLGRNLQELRESQALLQAARDELEARVRSRTHQLAQANERLRSQTEVLESVLQSMGEGVVVADADGSFQIWNQEAERITGLTAQQAERGGLLGARVCMRADGQAELERHQLPIERALAGEAVAVEMRIGGPGQPRWHSWIARPLGRQADQERGAVAVFRDITARKQAEQELRRSHELLELRVEERTAELREAQRQLVDTALAAGRAEVATNVLHNVGNVLSSVNVHVNVIRRGLGDRQWAALGRIARLLEEHEDALPAFVAGPKGRRLPELCAKLAAHQGRWQEQIGESVGKLHEQIEHIRQIVLLQQEHAHAVELIEPTDLESLLDDALGINEGALARHQIEVIREIVGVTRVRVDKHKVLQILINLISNAKYAMEQTSAEGRRLTIRVVRPDVEHVRVSVADNGCGIRPELLTRIFQHGFTTRREGHGFGLHASALAAAEMGGSIRAHSDGPGHGACFVLDLPVEQEA